MIHPEHIRYYDAKWDADNCCVTDLGGFLHQVESDLSDILLKDLETYNSIPWQERCMRSADRWFHEESKYTADTDNMTLSYVGTLVDGGEGAGFLYITGPAGSGKSVRISSLYCECTDEKLGFSYGLDKFSSANEQLLRVLIYKLEELISVPHTDYTDKDWFALTDTLLTLQEQVEHCSVYIDNAGEDLLSLLSYMEKLFIAREGAKLNISFSIAVQEDLPFYPFFYTSARIRLGELSEQDAASVLECIVKSHHKELSEVVKEHILSKSRSRSAAYLKSIVKRLMILDSDDFAAIRAMGDGMDNINKYMISIVDKASNDLYGILLELIDEAKERINKEFVGRLMAVFAYVPLRISSAEIKGIFSASGWEYNDLDFTLAIRMLEDIVKYYPETSYYGIKNEEIRRAVKNNCQNIDARSIAEYMSADEALRPYAFESAISCDDFELLYRILKETEIEDISKSIRYLIRCGETQKAIGLVTYLSEFEELWYVKMLPDVNSFETEEQRRQAYDFLWSFYDSARPRITGDTRLLLEQAVNAGLTALDYYVKESWKNTIDRLCEMLDFIRETTNEFDLNIVEQMLFIMLKAVNASKSAEVFECYIQSESYLSAFRSETPYHKTVLKMKAYYEFYEMMRDFVDCDDALKYWEKAYDLYCEVDYTDEIKPEDFFCFARLDGDIDELMLGKSCYPLSYDMMRYEIKFTNEDSDDDDGQKPAFYDMQLDKLKKCKALVEYTGSVKDAQLYLQITASFAAGDEFDDMGADEFMEYLEKFIGLFGVLLDKGLLLYNDYVLLIPVAEILFQYSDFDETVEELFEAAECNDEFCTLMWKVARILASEDEEEGAMAKLYGQYMKMRHLYVERAQMALNTLDYYFSEAGFDIEE